MRRLRIYRVVRVFWVVVLTAPRYVWMLWREQKRPLPQEAWDAHHHRAGRRIAALILHLRGLFVKVAQVIAARDDIFPAPLVAELARFHDDLPAVPFSELRSAVEKDLGRDLDEAFAHVEEDAIAAASLAQVHLGTLTDGSPVVLKVQYPSVGRLVPTDLRSIGLVAKVIQRINRKVDLRTIVAELSRFVALELDFSRERESLERTRSILAGRDDIVAPRPIPELCTKKLLTMERIHGTALTQMERLRAEGLDLAKVARTLGSAFASMIFEHGFFHGDPHPGNVMVMADGRVALIDFGLTKELPPGFAADAALLIVRSLAHDAEGARRAADRLGFTTEGDDFDVGALIRTLMGDPTHAMSPGEFLADPPLARLPEAFTLLGRCLFLLNGISSRLAPGERLLQQELSMTLLPIAAAAMSADA